MSIVISLACDRHCVQHLLVEALCLLRLAAGNAIKIDVFLDLDDLATDKHTLLLAFAELRQLPRLLRPLCQAPLDQLFKHIRRSLLLFLGSTCILFSEDDLKKESKELARLLLVWEQEHIKAQVIEVAEMLEILRKLLARFESICRFTQVLLLEVCNVNELILLRKHAVNAFEACDSCTAHRLSIEGFQAIHVDAESLELH